jgi:branched-chain amino acid transport system ATP-binding protein
MTAAFQAADLRPESPSEGADAPRRAAAGTTAAPLLETTALTAFYGDAQALFGIDFTLQPGELVAIIGANGAGKSTFMKALTGLVSTRAEQVRFNGEPIGGLRPGDIVKRGLALVPEGRRLFPSLSVEENLKMGAFAGRAGPWNLDRLYGLFPILAQKRRLPATSLSGGQQQMVAIGRALMSNPSLLLCDELSLGLAPIVIREIYDAMPAITAEGMTVVIVEQDVAMARQVSSRIYCFQEGRVSLQGLSSELSREQISKAYFGV